MSSVPLQARRLAALTGALAALAVTLLSPCARAEASDPEPGASSLHFLGWSKDSRWIAYRRVASTPRRTAQGLQAERREQRMHRRVRDGRFDGFGKMVGGDVAAFAVSQGYVVDAVPPEPRGPRVFEFALGGARLVLEIDIGAHLGARLSQDGVTVFQHQFDRLYVGFQPELYPSPDRTQAVLVMHLDSGWDVDAAIFPLRLRALPAPSPDPAPVDASPPT